MKEKTTLINYKKNKKNIINKYFKQKNIFIISKKYDVSPIRIIKLLLKHHHVSNNNINKILILVSKKFDMIKRNILLILHF